MRTTTSGGQAAIFNLYEIRFGAGTTQTCVGLLGNPSTCPNLVDNAKVILKGGTSLTLVAGVVPPHPQGTVNISLVGPGGISPANAKSVLLFT